VKVCIILICGYIFTLDQMFAKTNVYNKHHHLIQY